MQTGRPASHAARAARKHCAPGVLGSTSSPRSKKAYIEGEGAGAAASAYVGGGHRLGVGADEGVLEGLDDEGTLEGLDVGVLEGSAEGFGV